MKTASKTYIAALALVGVAMYLMAGSITLGTGEFSDYSSLASNVRIPASSVTESGFTLTATPAGTAPATVAAEGAWHSTASFSNLNEINWRTGPQGGGGPTPGGWHD